jgi:hypothetical protein
MIIDHRASRGFQPSRIHRAAATEQISKISRDNLDLKSGLRWESPTKETIRAMMISIAVIGLGEMRNSDLKPEADSFI